ncbi:MAG: LysR family transcriptional regulator [Euzebyales bacterium]|jgi:DNA-binding transcriptional LysR family regulator|nr:LysR family transcriptional regulator [Euzebyales bacterium]
MALSRRVSDLAPLELLVTVVELGSLSRAATAHGISQPSASVAIARLERRLGVTLLRRRSTGSVPTDDGELVVAWARELVTAARALDTSLEALGEQRSQRLRLAASYTIAEYVLQGWLTALRRTAPSVEIHLAVHNSATVIDQMLAGRADLGFVEGLEVRGGVLASRPVGCDELVVITHPGHPWTRRDRPLAARVLAAERLVTRESGSGTREVAEQRLAAHSHGRLPPPLLELGSTTAVKAAVVDGAGPAIISRLTIQQELADGRLRVVPVADLDLHRVFRAVWPANSRLIPAAAELIRNAAQDMAP